MKTNYTDTELQASSRSQLRPLTEAGEVPEGCVRYYTYKKDGEWTTKSKYRAMQDTHYIDTRLPESEPLVAEHKALTADEWAEAETFEAHDKTWTKHKPGDPMPCDGSSAVTALLGDGTFCTQQAEDWNWNNRDSKFDIVGWRYADEPTPEPLVTKPISLTSPTQINDGGPAFPNLGYNKEANYNGMTLRDWFAGQALASMTVAPDYSKGPCNFAMAERAYCIADAMLKAREVKP